MTSNVYKKTRTPVVEKAVIIPPPPTVPDRPAAIAPAVLVESPPQSAPSQLDRIEAALSSLAADVVTMKRRLQC